MPRQSRPLKGPTTIPQARPVQAGAAGHRAGQVRAHAAGKASAALSATPAFDVDASIASLARDFGDEKAQHFREIVVAFRNTADALPEVVAALRAVAGKLDLDGCCALADAAPVFCTPSNGQERLRWFSTFVSVVTAQRGPYACYALAEAQPAYAGSFDLFKAFASFVCGKNGLSAIGALVSATKTYGLDLKRLESLASVAANADAADARRVLTAIMELCRDVEFHLDPTRVAHLAENLGTETFLALYEARDVYRRHESILELFEVFARRGGSVACKCFHQVFCGWSDDPSGSDEQAQKAYDAFVGALLAATCGNAKRRLEEGHFSGMIREGLSAAELDVCGTLASILGKIGPEAYDVLVAGREDYDGDPEKFRIFASVAESAGADALRSLLRFPAIHESREVLRFAGGLSRFGGRSAVLFRQLNATIVDDRSVSKAWDDAAVEMVPMWAMKALGITKPVANEAIVRRCDELRPLVERIGSLGPIMVRRYLAAKDGGDCEHFFHRVEAVARDTDSSRDVFSALADDDRALAEEIVAAVFAPTAGAQGNPEDLPEYPDRSADLSDLKIRDEYPVSVLGYLEFEEREPINRSAMEAAAAPVARAQKSMLGKPEDNLRKLHAEAVDLVEKAAGLPTATTTEGNILLAATASGPNARKAAKNLVTDYRFRDGRVRDYVQRSAAQGEALPSELARLRHTLSYLSEFYRDDLKEAIKSLVDTARKNDPEAVRASESALARDAASRVAAASRLRDPAALKKALAGVTKIPDESVRRVRAAVVLRKNGWEGDEASLPADAAGLAALVDGLAADAAPVSAAPVPTLESALHELFREEVAACGREMSKIIPKSDGGKTTALRLTGKILKTPYSALARLPAGVCVSADKPGADTEYCMWTDPAYLQMVFFNPDAKFPSCEGLVMMHRYEDAGRKILVVSPNPSNSFVLASDGKALFAEILKTVVAFAQDNGFDYVCASNDPAVRANRTGDFLAALENACAGEKIALSKNCQFSGEPEYWQCRGGEDSKDLSIPVLWKRG